MNEDIIIIKSKKLDLEETCTAVGDYVIRKDDDSYYRLPTTSAGPRVDGQIVMSLKKFYDYFINELQYIPPFYLQSFFILSGEAPFGDVQWEDMFMKDDFLSLQDNALESLRLAALKTQSQLMIAYLDSKIKELLTRVDEFEVCYINVHY